MLRLGILTAFTLVLSALSASADCKSDTRQYNQAADQYNALVNQGGCATSGAESAVAISLLQHALEMRQRLEGCNFSGGTSVAQLQSMIDSFGEDNATCQAIDDFKKAIGEEQKRLNESISQSERLAKAYKAMGDAIEAEEAGGVANQKKAAKLYREAADLFGSAGMDQQSKSALAAADAAETKAKDATKKVIAPTPKEKPKQQAKDNAKQSDKCKAPLAALTKMQAEGKDVTVLRQELAKLNCK